VSDQAAAFLLLAFTMEEASPAKESPVIATDFIRANEVSSFEGYLIPENV